MKTLIEYINEGILDNDKKIEDRIDSHIMVLKLDKFAQSYLTEEQWKFIATYAKSQFPQIYEMTATKGDGYNLDREKNSGTVNDRDNVDIRVRYSKFKVNRSNNLRAVIAIMYGVRIIQGRLLWGADRLEHSHTVRDKEGVYNIHFSDRGMRSLQEPEPSALDDEERKIYDGIKIEKI